MSALDALQGGILAIAGQQLLAGFEDDAPATDQVGLDSGAIAGFGVPHGVEQQVGDLGHGRNHNRDRPHVALFGARRAATRMRSAEPTLVPPNFITSRSFNGIPFRWKSAPERL